MNTQEMKEQILAFLDGQLSEEEQKALSQEISGNKEAEDLLAEMVLLHGSIASAVQEAENSKEPSALLIQKLLDKEKAEQTEGTAKPVKKKIRWWMISSAAAAGILLVLVPMLLPIFSSARRTPSDYKLLMKTMDGNKNRDWSVAEDLEHGAEEIRENDILKEDAKFEHYGVGKKKLADPMQPKVETEWPYLYSKESPTVPDTGPAPDPDVPAVAQPGKDPKPLEMAEIREVEILNFSTPEKKLEKERVQPRPTHSFLNPRTEYAPSEQYEPITENSFNNPEDKPLSTFSIDVDTASYSNVRRFISRSQLPPAGAVRIEEMINYFDYDYPEPTDEHPFALYAEISECPWNTAHQLVHIGVQGKTLKKSRTPNSNLVFLLDVSGSMRDNNKLPLLKQTMKLLVDSLGKYDRISIVTYSNTAQVVLSPTPGNSKARVKSVINSLHAGGSTAGERGLRLAYDTAAETFMEEGNNRIILASDGDFNVGMTSDDALVQLIEKERKRGIFLTILGFGTGNIKDAKLEKIADKGNGSYHYIDSILEGKKVMMDQISGTLHTIAKDVKIQIEFNPANVKEYRLIGYENRKLNKRDFNDDTKDAGELGSGHTVTALYELVTWGSEGEKEVDELRYQKSKPREKKADLTKELLNFKLRYKHPEGEKSILVTKPLMYSAIPLKKSSANFRFAAAVAEFGLILRNSAHRANASLEQVISLAQGSKGEDTRGYRAEFIKLAETVQLLKR